MAITPPIVIAEGMDVMIFRSRSDAEKSIEARDVVGATLRAWDASGQPLRLDIGDAMCIDLARVTIGMATHQGPHVDDLAHTLRAFLAALGTVPPQSTTVAELVELSVAFSGYSV